MTFIFHKLNVEFASQETFPFKISMNNIIMEVYLHNIVRKCYLEIQHWVKTLSGLNTIATFHASLVPVREGLI